MEDLVTRIITKQESLKSYRTPWENLWQDCGEYVNPNRGDFSTIRYRGDTSRYDNIFDTTAPLANENLASGLQGFLTSPSQRWFSLSTYDDAINEQHNVKEWLNLCTNILYDRVFNIPDSSRNQCPTEYSSSGALCPYK